MNVKTIFSLVLLNVLTEGNPNNPVNLNFDLKDKPKVKEVKGVYKRVKLTTYFCPTIYARRSPTGKFIHRINVDKNGKVFPIYVRGSKSLYVEGFAKISLPTETFYLDHQWTYHEFPKNKFGRKLSVGQAASRAFKSGTKFIYKGDTITITDTGSGLNNYNQVDLFVPESKYKKITEYAEVLFINNN